MLFIFTQCLHAYLEVDLEKGPDMRNMNAVHTFVIKKKEN